MCGLTPVTPVGADLTLETSTAGTQDSSTLIANKHSVPLDTDQFYQTDRTSSASFHTLIIYLEPFAQPAIKQIIFKGGV